MKSRASCVFALSLAFSSIGFCQSETANTASRSFTVSGSQPWTDTGIDLAAGDTVGLAAVGKNSPEGCTPEGATGNPGSSTVRPLASAPAGALIARISEKSEPLLVGSKGEIHADSSGRLFLGLNQETTSSCDLEVTATLAHAGQAAQKPSTKQQLSSAAQVWLKGQFGTGANAAAGSPGAPAAASPATPQTKLPSILLDAELRKHLDELPRRVDDHMGNLGDMVNFVIVGSQERMQSAFSAADWHVADVDNKEAGLKAIVNTYQKKEYLEMPMSLLYLFDRTQDFGYEQAQAYAVVASRHHFRIWKAPFTWKNGTVWVGAGTHDIGFEKDVRNGKLTHKIDPDVDLERDNIAQGLEKSGKAQSISYYLPPDPVQEARNATGGSYHSDGRILVVFLK